MTVAERALWLRAEREARQFRPAMQAAILRTWRTVASGLSIAAMERILTAGAIAQLAETIAEAAGEMLGATYTPIVRETFATAAQRQVGRLPRQLAGVRFDLLNPQTVRAALALETTALRTLTVEVAETVRQAAARGLAEGVGPRAVARGIRDAVGLAPSQEAAVANFRAALEAGDFTKARTYGLRDRRFDPTLAKGQPLTPGRIDDMTTAYRNRYVAHNAETHARTAALDAQRAGAREAWETALRDGEFDRQRVTKRWVATLDARTRPEHAAANGTVVQFDQPYPVDGGVMVPGEGTYNCRCVELIRIEVAGSPFIRS